MSFRPTLLVLGITAAAASSAHASIVHDENVNGDLSNDRFAPSPFVLAQGTNSLLATSVQGDREFVALTVPAGQQLSSIIQVSYVGDDGVAFCGVQAGPQLTVDPDSFDPTGLLGWTHFGPFIFVDGSDILPSMGNGFGADGFTPPLPAGTYTFWLQQAGQDPATYQLDFMVTPTPSAAAIFGIGAIIAVRRRR